MKTLFKTTVLITFLSVIVLYSNTIQKGLVDRYNKGIAFLSSHTLTKTNISGF